MSDWPVHSLSEFISIKHGFAFKGEYFKSEETNNYLLTPGNFAVGGGFKADKFKYYDGPVPVDYILREGDLVVTMTDLSKQADTLGYSALVPTIVGKKLLHNQRVGLVEYKNNELDKTYLYFLLCSREYRHHVVSGATGTTVKHTSPTKIVSFEFQKPPLGIQVEIGKKLLILENKIELNRQINQTLEQIAQAIFKSWFVDFEPVRAKIEAKQHGQDPELAAMCAISGKTGEQLKDLDEATLQQLKTIAALFPDALVDSELGEIPEGWGVKSMEELSNIVAMGPFGSNIKVSTFVDDGIPVVSGQHLKGIMLEDNEFNFVTIGHADKLKKANVMRGDVVFTHAGSIGQVAYIPEKSRYERYVLSQRQFYMRPKQDVISPLFITYYFKSHIGQYELLSNASQVGVPSISRPVSNLRKITAVVPCKDLSDEFHKLVNTMHNKISESNTEINILENIKNALLPKLLSGELEINNVA